MKTSRPRRQRGINVALVSALVAMLVVFFLPQPALAATGWYDANWKYRKRITIDNTKVPGTSNLTNFPVLINRTDADWKDTANEGHVGKSDGTDIFFTNSSGTKLDHEIEKYTASTGELVAWVEVDSVSYSSDTDIYIYYGNSGAADQQNVTGTWDSNYQMVQHLEEEPTDTYEFDATDCQEPDIVHVTGDIYAIAYRGTDSDGFLRTVTIASDGAITDSVIDTLEFDIVQGFEPDIINVSGDIYAIAYRGNGSDGYVVTVDINSDGTIDDTVKDSLEFNGTIANVPSIVHVRDDIYAIAYDGPGGDGFLTTVDIDSTGTIEDIIPDTEEFDTQNGHTPDAIKIADGVVAVAYRGYESDGFLETLSIDVSGIITQTDSLEFDGTDGYEPDMINISGDIYAIVYRSTSTYGELVTVDISSAGDIDDSGITDSWVFNSQVTNLPKIVNVSGNIYVVAYAGTGSDGWAETVTIAANGTITESVIETYEWQTTAGNAPDIINVSGDTFAVAYRDSSGDGLVRTIKVNSSGSFYDIEDSTSNAKDGVIVNMLTGSQANAKVDGGLTFDGSDDSADYGASSFNLDFGNSFTFHYWQKTAATGDYPFAKGDGTDGYRMYLDTGGDLNFQMRSSNSTGVILRRVDAGASDDAWHHVVVTYDGSRDVSGLKIYVDASEPSTQSTTNTVTGSDVMTTSMVFYLGRNSGSTAAWYNGSMDEFRISNTARTADWITATYNNQSSPSTFYSVSVEQVDDWESYKEALHQNVWGTAENHYNSSFNTVYMYGENFTAGHTYSVGFYDADGNKAGSDVSGTLDGSNLSAQYILSSDPARAAGTWNAVTFDTGVGSPPTTYAATSGAAGYVVEDDFIVDGDAIPEFPTVLAAIGVAGLCFGVYYWMRKRRLAYVKA